MLTAGVAAKLLRPIPGYCDVPLNKSDAPFGRGCQNEWCLRLLQAITPQYHNYLVAHQQLGDSFKLTLARTVALCITRYTCVAPFAFRDAQSENFSDFLAGTVVKSLSPQWEGLYAHITREFDPVFQTYYEYKAENDDLGACQNVLDNFVCYLRHAGHPEVVNGAMLVPPEVDQESLQQLFERHRDQLLFSPDLWVPYLMQLHVGQLSFFLCNMAFSGFQ